MMTASVMKELSHRPAACNFIKKELVSQLFPVNFAKSLRTHICELIRIARVSLAFQAANKFVQYRPHWF